MIASHPVISLFSAIVSSVGLIVVITLKIEWMWYEGTGWQLASHQEVQAIRDFQQSRNDLMIQLQSDRLDFRRQLDLSQGHTEEIRKLLEDERRRSAEQLEGAKQWADLQLEALRRQFSERSTTDRQFAAMNESDLRSELRAQEDLLRALQHSYPSLESRGLWDQGSPSPRALRLATELPDPIRSPVLDALTTPGASRQKQAQVVELLATHSEKSNECEHRKADVERVEGEHEARRISIGSEPLRDGEARSWFNSDDRPVEVAKRHFERCAEDLGSLAAELESSALTDSDG